VSTHAKNLASLLTIGGRQSWMLPELASLNRLPPTATLTVALSRVNSGDNVLMTSSTWSSPPVITPSTRAWR